MTKPLANVNYEGLPDLTPKYIDIVVKTFVPNLCCEVHPVAIVRSNHICQRCFERLKEEYSGDAWSI